MREGNLKIRVATLADAEALLEIYAPYVQNTAISFELEVPSITEFRGRIEKTLPRFPYLVAESGGVILGYAYATPFKERKAYSWTVEESIYVRLDRHKTGVGRALMTALEGVLREQRVLSVCACIAYAAVEDEYLQNNSTRFHEHMGFRLVGQFKQCGHKFGRWYDMVWMEKHLGEHVPDAAEVLPFPQVRGIIAEKYGIE